MRKIAVVLLLTMLFTSPSYAVNPVDTVVCKKVVLRANNRTILVNRLTGEVKYILNRNGVWVFLKGEHKNECQAMYNAQKNLKPQEKMD